MMGRADFLYSGFISRLAFPPTSCQDDLLKKVAGFISSDDDDILVVNGYAGTGKTTAMSAVISVLREYRTKCVLLAPTGRAAKVLSSYAGQPAYTIHKHIFNKFYNISHLLLLLIDNYFISCRISINSIITIIVQYYIH